MRRTIVLGVALAIASCAPKPETVLEDTLKAVEQGHCDGFSQRFSTATRQMMGAKLDRACTQQAAKAAREPEGKRIAEVRVLDRAVNGDVATIRAEVHYQNGTVDRPLTVRMVKEEGTWRLEPSK